MPHRSQATPNPSAQQPGQRLRPLAHQGGWAFRQGQDSADHVFAAEGSDSSHEAEFSTLDALREQLDSAFTSITGGSTDGDSGGPPASSGLGVASN